MDIENKSNEISTARTGEQLNNESPIEEVRRLNKETKEMFEQMNAAKIEMQKSAAEMQLAGRGFAGQQIKEKTQDEKDQEDADKILKRFK